MTFSRGWLATVTLGTASMCLGMSAAAEATSQPAAKSATVPVGVPAVSLPAMSAAQVVDRYVAARGGLATWQAVQTMSWKGKMGAGATTYAVITEKGKLEQKQREETLLPFRFEFKRATEEPARNRIQRPDGGAGVRRHQRLEAASLPGPQ